MRIKNDRVFSVFSLTTPIFISILLKNLNRSYIVIIFMNERLRES
jgi:hypothetical protein